MKSLFLHVKRSLTLPCLLMVSSQLYAQIPEYEASLLSEFQAFDARQGVAVDEEHFFAINNTRITMHDKTSGKVLLQWGGGPDAGSDRLMHLDGGMVLDDLLYAAHSNYPESPMISSVEIWNALTLEHIASYSFGVMLGSLTWLDFYEGNWWATFANYDRVQPGDNMPYGTTAATTLVKMNQDFDILQSWLFPAALHERFTPMSNSGGSWGDDGYLYITGHDHPEIYVVQVPDQGNEVEWQATVKAPWIAGQGIAWDRNTDQRIMWGILRQEEKVIRFSVPPIARN